MARRPRALFVMPGFSRYEKLRRGQDFESFFNPLATFERVVIASPGESRSREIGTLRIEPLPASRPLPWAIAAGEAVYGLADPLAESIRRLAEDHAVDLVAQRYGGPLFHGLPAVWAARRLHRPALVTMQNDYQAILRHRWPWARMTRRTLDPAPWRYLFRHATAVWCVSDHVRRLAAGLGAPPRKLVTIPNKDSVDRFAKPPDSAVAARLDAEIPLPRWGKRLPVFLSVGRLVAQKNVSTMLDAFARFAAERPDAAYLVVGQGPLRSRLGARIRVLGLEASVHVFDRGLTAGELAVLYARADALVFASRFEGHGRVAYEALACGTPVIGSRRPPITDMVIDGETGFTADPQSAAAIAAAMERVAAGELAGPEPAERCRAVARRYDLSRVNPLEAGLYRRLLAGEAP